MKIKRKGIIFLIGVLIISLFSMIPLNTHSNKDVMPWMSYIHDDTKISDISIPGTHDSGATHSIFDVSGKCQDLTIKQQLNVGTRFFDLRLQLVKEEFRKKKIGTAIINEIKEIRINNTLSQFNKKRLIQLAQKIENLNNYLLDSEMSKYASIILDGTLKAASDENLIFVFPSENTSKIFNNNLIEIEETIKKVLDNHYKVIATDINHWEKIKLEFNSRKRKYTYQKEEFDLKNFHNHQKTEFSDFEDLIEYQ